MKPGLADICFSISSLAMIILPRAAGGPSGRGVIPFRYANGEVVARRRHPGRPATLALPVVPLAAALGHAHQTGQRQSRANLECSACDLRASLFGKPRKAKTLGEASAMFGIAIGAECVRKIGQSQAGVD